MKNVKPNWFKMVLVLMATILCVWTGTFSILIASIRPAHASNVTELQILNGANSVEFTGQAQNVVTGLPENTSYAISTSEIDPTLFFAYKQINGLTTADSYIDTGFVPNQDTRLTMTSSLAGLGNNETYFYGAGGGHCDELNFEAYVWNFPTYQDPVMVFNYNNEPDSPIGAGAITANTLIYIDHNKNVCNFTSNGQTLSQTFTYANFTCPKTLYLFTLNRTNQIYKTSKNHTIYECKIYDNGTLVRNYVPAKDKAGKVGLYDLLNNRFYKNETVGSFTGGENIGNIVFDACGLTWHNNAAASNMVLQPNQTYYVYYFTNNGDGTATDVQVKNFTVTHTHQYTETTVPATCVDAGKTTKTCICGDVQETPIPATGVHVYDPNGWVITQNATCTVKGSQQQKCLTCDHVEIQEIPLIDHNYVWEQTVAPTHTTTGTRVETCTVCGGTRNSETLPMVAHEYVKTTFAPTCTAQGYDQFVCSCGAEYIGNLVPANGHSYQDETIAPTCATAGYTKHTCTVCDHTYNDAIVEATNAHEYEAWVVTVNATCTQTGSKFHKCRNCTYEESQEIAMLEHDYQWVQTVNPTHTQTGTRVETCKVCSQTRNSETVAALTENHTYTAVVTAPSCTAQGYTTYTCAECGATYIGDLVAMTEHQYQNEVVAATCAKAGYTKHTCQVCQHTYNDSIVEATGNHLYDDAAWVVTQAATCTETGLETQNCQVCGTVNSRILAKLPHDYIWQEAKAPTHTTDGELAEVCTVCAATSGNTEVIPMLEHEYTKTTVAATCTERGYDQYLCACGHSYVDNWAVALGHDYVAVATAATCTTTGYTDYTCSRCQETYRDDFVDALGHSWTDWVATAATCTEDGEKHRTCTICHETQSEILPALGHDYGDWQTTVAATCTTAGQNERTCGHCGHVETEPIAMLEHVWSVWTTDTEDKHLENRTCELCGTIQTRNSNQDNKLFGMTRKEFFIILWIGIAIIIISSLVALFFNLFLLRRRKMINA